MPHVGDAGGGLTALRGGGHSADGFAVIPKMNAVVVSRMIRLNGKNLIQHGIDDLGAGNGHITFAKPDAPDEKDLGLNVFWILLHEVFEVADAVELALLFVSLVVLVEVFEHGDPLLFTGGSLILELHGLAKKTLGALVVVHVGHGHAPVGHGAVLIVRSSLAEAALCFIIPETVKLPDALREKLLRIRVLRADRKLYRVPVACNEHGGLPWAFVESFSMSGMAGERFGTVERDGKEQKKE